MVTVTKFSCKRCGHTWIPVHDEIGVALLPYATAADDAVADAAEIAAHVTACDSVHTFSQVVAGVGGTATGSFTIGANQGICYQVYAEVTAGASTDTDIELADAAFGGGHNDLYQIGVGGVPPGPLWNPTVDGVWNDRNAWGIVGLAANTLYWKITNNGAVPATYSVTIRVHVA